MSAGAIICTNPSCSGRSRIRSEGCRHPSASILSLPAAFLCHEICTHVLNQGGRGVQGPLDQ